MTPRLSIVQVSPTAGGGGAADVAWTLHREYTARGHDARLLVGPSPGSAADVLTMRNGGGLWAAHDRLRESSHPRAARIARALASPGVVADAALGREDFRFPGTKLVEDAAATVDIVQLHNLHGAYFDLRILPRLSKRVPVVLSPHDVWLTTGHCAHTLGCERWRTGCGHCPHLRVYPALLRDGTAGNWVRKKSIYASSSLRVAVPCRWLADILADSILAPAITEVRVVPHGVDLTLFHPGDRAAERGKLGLDPGARILVFAAQGVRTNDFKDYETFVQALKLLGSMAEEPIVAVALGASHPGTKQLGRVVLREVRSVPSVEVGSWLRAADLYVHSSRAETFPLAVLEALACGLPVVASAVGGIPEQITERTGELVPAGDAPALSAAMHVLLRDVGRRREMGRAAASDAASRFGRDRQADSYIDWFDELRTDRPVRQR